MASVKVAVLGDNITHITVPVGTITSAAIKSRAEGKFIARHGDQVNCSVHGIQTIVATAVKTFVEGKLVARNGDQTTCLAFIVASTLKTFAE